MNEKTKFGEKVNTLTSGSKDMSEPIGVTLLPIHVAFDAHYYKALSVPNCVLTPASLEKPKTHIRKMLCKYPRLRRVFRALGN